MSRAMECDFDIPTADEFQCDHCLEHDGNTKNHNGERLCPECLREETDET